MLTEPSGEVRSDRDFAGSELIAREDEAKQVEQPQLERDRSVQCFYTRFESEKERERMRSAATPSRRPSRARLVRQEGAKGS